MPHKDFISAVHTQTKRDYLKRVTEYPKAEAGKIARRFDFDYWDGDRKFGYGGFKYDGRWQKVANALAEHYQIKPGDKVLDIGCGKAFLLHDLTQAVPGIEVKGLDVSQYAIDHAKEEVKNFLVQGSATNLPFKDNEFDFVVSINTLHNLNCGDLENALKEMQRVSKDKSYLVVESYRNLEEKVNLMYWQLTCEAFYSPEEWQWWFDRAGYKGDYGFIYFE